MFRNFCQVVVPALAVFLIVTDANACRFRHRSKHRCRVAHGAIYRASPSPSAVKQQNQTPRTPPRISKSEDGHFVLDPDDQVKLKGVPELKDILTRPKDRSGSIVLDQSADEEKILHLKRTGQVLVDDDTAAPAPAPPTP